MKVKLETRTARIELIPLIDIIFLLLVFFIYSMLSMVVYRGIPVTLPEAETTETETEESLVVTIDADGEVFLNKESVAVQDLLSRLKQLHTAAPEQGIIISGHGEADYRVVVDVLDKVRFAGFTRVSMEARPREEDL